jgi:hypothetical protein
MGAGRWKRKISQKSLLQIPFLHLEPQTKITKFKTCGSQKEARVQPERPKDRKIKS